MARAVAKRLAELDAALRLAVKAARLQAIVQAMARVGPPNLYSRVLGLAVSAEDEAWAAANRVRVALGGEPLPDPAEPPPHRPDD